MSRRTRIDREARILILGAGPGGLSAAHFLRRHGYKNVTVFEKLGRVGGMCRSITEDNQAFDLGAVFASSSYREVLRMARLVGARLERFVVATAIRWDPEPGTGQFGGLLRHVLGESPRRRSSANNRSTRSPRTASSRIDPSAGFRYSRTWLSVAVRFRHFVGAFS